MGPRLREPAAKPLRPGRRRARKQHYMRYLLILSLTGALNAAPPQAASRGCVQTSTVTIEAENCLQVECLEQANGNCTLRECTRTQKKKYTDNSATGCTRVVDCGKGAYFVGGVPGEPETESTEVCDWRACVENDPATGACTSYQCLSRRTFQTESVAYAGARCVKNGTRGAAAPAAQRDGATQPFTINPVPAREALQDMQE